MADILGGDEFLGSSSNGSESSYVASLGRISGKLLNSNLLRNGADLAFDTNLLYLKVGPYKPGTDPDEDGDPSGNASAVGSGIGINTDAFSADFEVNGNSKVRYSTIVDNEKATIGDIVINTNGTFSTNLGSINIVPYGPDSYVEYDRVINDELEIKNNYISVTQQDTNLTLGASGSGSVSFQSNSKISGNLDVTGSITAHGNVRLDGQLIIGDSPFDYIVINPDLTQDIIPGDDLLYSLGTSSKKWSQIWLDGDINSSNVSITNLIISDQMLVSGHTFTTIQSNDDLFVTSDTGLVQLERLEIDQNQITNLDNTPLTLSFTGTGYSIINDTNGMRIPVGTTAERGYTEIGETRWNTDLGYLECFDGSVYLVATGGGTVVTPAIMEELSNVYALVFG